MILPDEEIIERFESPANLLNRLKSNLRRTDANFIPSIPPRSDEIIPDLNSKLSTGSLKSKAAAIMDSALTELKSRIADVDKPRELASIAESMNKVITAESEKKTEEKPQIIIYSPSVISENHFESITVND